MRPKSLGLISSNPAADIGAGGVAGGVGVRGTLSMLKRSGSEICRARRGMVRRIVSLSTDDQTSPRESHRFQLLIRLSVVDQTDLWAEKLHPYPA
jgi:hypothetical protein